MAALARAPFPTLATHFFGSQARGRNQLLPRYWPRITDQELQQIPGDSNSVITPLFEQTLSASDAGEIERIVVPKECAEAYFPSISQPEGLPLKVQDAKGSEWIFQFKFLLNNNSRMYVLEGVTPCIQSMQLEAGDKVTFSRLEPEGKLVMRPSTAPPSDQAKLSQAPGKKGRDGEEPREEEDASISEQRPEQQLEESFEQYDAHFQGNMGRAEPRLRPGKRRRDCNRGEAVSGTSHARRNKRISQ